MHKITKGLKKKKKGKKSKRKEEDLFKPEELEAYRRDHQDESSASVGQNEEWKKFLALTSGVDDVLKKTQGDLDRIKSTSFFQRVPPQSEVKKLEQVAENSLIKEKEKDSVAKEKTDIGIIQVSDSETEDEEEDDDIFNTAYINAIASGEVKLAYIPESPVEETASDDPFDTSIAERAILGPAVEKKGKKLVPIGSAVEVLTGRVQLPTCATVRPAAKKRQVHNEKDLLLRSFDNNVNSIANDLSENQPSLKTLLDEDTPIPLTEKPIDLHKDLCQILPSGAIVQKNNINNDVNEFSNKQNNFGDEVDEEFAKLAAESLYKTPVLNSLASESILPVKQHWTAFTEQSSSLSVESTFVEDPFDTTFADNIIPSKLELKIIEKEILTNDDNVDSNLPQILNKVSIKVTDPAGQRESISSLDRVSEADLNLIKPIHRDLLGGSNTDLSNLSDKPLKPSEQIDENYIEYCDPFDTSVVEASPGQTELKFLEKELLSDFKTGVEDFDPRANEPKERTLSRPDVLNITQKTVSFDLPSPQQDLLDGEEEQCNKVLKPLTPFYVRKDSISEKIFSEQTNLDLDPFDTSFVCDIGPGKAELKQIEKEIFYPITEQRLNISDQDLCPRIAEKNNIQQVVQSIRDITKNKPSEVENKQIDLLDIDQKVSVKVLTPSIETTDCFNYISYADPFDTSIAKNIVPGKTELRLLESEFIQSTELVDQNFDPRSFGIQSCSVDLLDDSSSSINDQPLNPVVDLNDSLKSKTIDPFDTSIANEIVPGKAELKLLESELI